MARYIQQTPPAPPEFGMKEMEAIWKVIVPVDQRPKKKMNNLNLDNLFSVTLRDAGEIALIDGDSKKIISILKTGYAVHISRMSASGRYLFVIGRDAKINLIDLWMEKPDNVAEIKVGLEARSVETSKFKGYEDKYAIAGAYWPPQYVIMDGDTLEPLQDRRHPRHDRRHAGIPPRAARGLDRRLALQAGVRRQRQGNRQDLMVDYRDLEQPEDHRDRAPRASCMTAASTRRSATSWMAANASNKIAVIDTKEDKLVAAGRSRQDAAPGSRRQLRPSEVRSGLGHRPPGRRDHLADRHRSGEAQGERLEGRATLKGQGGGSLFIKTHPKSKNLYVDTPLNPDAKHQPVGRRVRHQQPRQGASS